MLPEANELLQEEYKTKYPWAFLLCLCGYLLILFLEKVAFNAHELMKHEHAHEDEQSYSYQQEEEAFTTLMVNRVKLMRGLSEEPKAYDKEKEDKEDAQALLLSHYDEMHQGSDHVGVGAYILACALSMHAVRCT